MRTTKAGCLVAEYDWDRMEESYRRANDEKRLTEAERKLETLKVEQAAHREWFTKDSGVREQHASGMVRDTQQGKPRFDLIILNGIPYEEQMLTRLASLLARGAEKYGERNFEKANTVDEMDRAKSSAMRHFVQWMSGEVDEDHAAAVMFNIIEVEMIRYRLGQNAG